MKRSHKMDYVILALIWLAVIVVGVRVVQAINNDLTPAPAQTTSSTAVTVNHGMQPFGQGQEDDDTAQLHVQPTYSPEVTLNGRLIQGSL